MDLDQLIESAAVTGQLQTGALRAKVAAHTSNRRLALTLKRGAKVHIKADHWSQADDEFLAANWGRLTLEQLAVHFGRSVAALKVRVTRDLRLKAPTKRPEIVTANMAAFGLGIDVHSMVKLIENGIVPGRLFPYQRGRRCFLIERQALAVFATNPLNWIYFRPENIGRSNELRRDRRTQKYDDGICHWFEQLRTLVLRRKALWNDEWWTPKQVGDFHGTTHMNVNNVIHDGLLPAVKWGNWHILRSDAVAIKRIIAWSGKGGPAQDHTYHSPAADAFMVLAAAVGESSRAIEAMQGCAFRNIEYRLRRLGRLGRLPWIGRHQHLPILFNRRGEMLADWKPLAWRFPVLARAMRRLRAGCELDQSELMTVRGVLCAWSRFFARTKAQRAIARGLKILGVRQTRHFREIVRQMRATGIDPYRKLDGHA